MWYPRRPTSNYEDYQNALIVLQRKGYWSVYHALLEDGYSPDIDYSKLASNGGWIEKLNCFNAAVAKLLNKVLKRK